MTRLISRALTSAACALLLASAASAGNLLVNGSFESGPPVPGLYVNLLEGSTAIPGWTVGEHQIDYVGPSAWNASQGQFNLDLDGSVGQPRNGSIYQTFATTIGQQYVVSFDLSGNIWGLPLVKQVEVSAGNAVEVHSFDIGAVVPFVTPGTLSYTHETLVFVAVSTSTTLTFKSLTQLSSTAPDHGPVLDNVVVEAGTATWTDIGFALAGVAGKPQLDGTGSLVAGSPGALVLSHAAPSAPALLFIALAAHPTPFKCGTLLPVPWVVSFALTTSPAGSLTLPWAAWPAGLSGLGIYYQVAVKDNAGICGASLSNAVRGKVP